MAPNNQEITVVTCTLGASARRLEALCSELRRFTSAPFEHIICDDGTINISHIDAQADVANRYNATWTYNTGPTWGISYNWNCALEHVQTPWAYLVEDALRPGRGWLETALDFVSRIGSKTWGPNHRRVGMAGFASIQDWQLALGNAWPGGRDVMDVFRGNNQDFYDRQGWNDGWWCWPRLLPGMRRSIEYNSAHWQSDVLLFKELAMKCPAGLVAAGRHPTDVEQAWQKWRVDEHWPQRRGAWCGWYPGAFMLVNMEAWRAVGRFRDGCTFFEGHLGVRMGCAGWLSLCVESPPWLHTPSLGFKAAGEGAGRAPRIHEDTRDVFLRDFGHDNMDAPNVIASGVVPVDEQRAIDGELGAVELWMDPGWKVWQQQQKLP